MTNPFENKNRANTFQEAKRHLNKMVRKESNRLLSCLTPANPTLNINKWPIAPLNEYFSNLVITDIINRGYYVHYYYCFSKGRKNLVKCVTISFFPTEVSYPSNDETNFYKDYNSKETDEKDRILQEALDYILKITVKDNDDPPVPRVNDRFCEGSNPDVKSPIKSIIHGETFQPVSNVEELMLTKEPKATKEGPVSTKEEEKKEEKEEEKKEEKKEEKTEKAKNFSNYAVKNEKEDDLQQLRLELQSFTEKVTLCQEQIQEILEKLIQKRL